jgi:hypothetical protein
MASKLPLYKKIGHYLLNVNLMDPKFQVHTSETFKLGLKNLCFPYYLPHQAGFRAVQKCEAKHHINKNRYRTPEYVIPYSTALIDCSTVIKLLSSSEICSTEPELYAAARSRHRSPSSATQIPSHPISLRSILLSSYLRSCLPFRVSR